MCSPPLGAYPPLVGGLLGYDPTRRISAAAALRDEYFAELCGHEEVYKKALRTLLEERR